MVMIIHEAISMAKPVVALVDVGKDFEKCFPILIVFKYGFLVVAAVGNVIYRAGVFYAEGPGHGGSLAGI
jgi:hypothetical protein